ncbi:MAG: serine/threonine-protein kinase, partial [Deltaproteobacteria bacterium]
MSEPRAPTGEPSPDATAFVSIRYAPVAEIGAGGMGTIFLARALSGPKRGGFVAIKRLFPHLESEPHVIASFLDEVWLTSKLNHPNVVEPLDWGRDEHGSYFVMRFVMGDSLRALLNAREMMQSPLPVEVVVDVITRAAAGLHAAHALKSDDGEPLELVHRDVSPSNVMIGYDGSVKLIDFGVAKARNAVGNGSEAGLVKGKYAYMSPEQIRGETMLDRRSDVFALGIVAWEALTLCRLYTAQREFEILRMVCEEEPVPPSELRAGVPPELDRIVLRCLAKNRDDRYPDCQALIDDLASLCPSPEVAVRTLAAVARHAMAERLAWIEQVTGQPVPQEEGPLAVGPDLTVRTEPPSERVL